MDRKNFERLVVEALEDLPAEFAEKLENVAVVVEDEPKREKLVQFHFPAGASLFGLYEGVQQTKRGAGYSSVPPDKITIFQKPIEYFCHSEEEIKARVRSTVLHEIGHHFGLSEKDLRKNTKT